MASSESSKLSIIVTCPEEIKEVLRDELTALGATQLEMHYKAVRAEVTERQFHEAHLKLRTASRVLRVVKDFPAHDERMLLDQAKRIRWSDIFAADRTFMIEGVPADRGEGIMSGNTISKKIREALQESFEKHTGTVPRVDLKEPRVTLVAYIRQGRCTLSIDTAGKSLHKRGYRTEGHMAPIKETLAAAVLHLAGYTGEQVLLDPMCGSGTLAIEGAMLAMHKSPMIHRKKNEFGFEWLKSFDKDLWREVQDEARNDRTLELKQPIYASDVNGSYIEIAKASALRARVEKYIQFKQISFFDVEAPAPNGIMVANMPYGERLMKDDDLKAFYERIGDTLKKRYAGWRVALLTAKDAPYKFIGLKPSRKIPLLNGSIESRLLIFEMYQGSRKKTAG